MVTVNTTNITGFIVLPNDAIRDKSSVIFTMTGFDTDADDNATIVPIPVVAAIGSDGSIDQDLWPNPEGVRTTFYRVTFSMYNGVNPVLVDGGLIEVPATGGPYDLNDLLPIAPPSGATVEEYIAQLAAAVASASSSADSAEIDAASAADSAQEAADSAQEAEDLVSAEPLIVLGMGASNMRISPQAVGGDRDIESGVFLWDSSSVGPSTNGAWTAGSQFNQAAFGTAPLDILDTGGVLYANSLLLQTCNAMRRRNPTRKVYGIMLASGGHGPVNFLTSATRTTNGWTLPAGTEDMTLNYSNIATAIAAVPGSKTVADVCLWYGTAGASDGQFPWQTQFGLVWDQAITSGLVSQDKTRIVVSTTGAARSSWADVKLAISRVATDRPNMVTTDSMGAVFPDNIHLDGDSVTDYGKLMAGASTGEGSPKSRAIVLTSSEHNAPEAMTIIDDWNGDNSLWKKLSDEGYLEANMNVATQVWRVTGTGDVDYMRVESTGIEDTPIGATTPSTGDFTELTAASLGGAAVQSGPTDATANKVLLNEAHGLGGVGISAPNDNCDDISVSGFYTFDSDDVNSPPFTNNGTITHIARTPTIRTQLAISRATPSLGRCAVRANDGSGWPDWLELLSMPPGAVTVDASERVHIGHDGSTSPGVGNSDVGTSLHPGGRAIHSRDSGPTQDLARVGATPDGKIQRFYRSGTEVGSISVKAGSITLDMTAAGVIWTTGAGTPEGFLSAPVGSMCTRTDGGAGTTLYVKESGTGNTGWVAK